MTPNKAASFQAFYRARIATAGERLKKDPDAVVLVRLDTMCDLWKVAVRQLDEQYGVPPEFNPYQLRLDL